MLDPTLRTQSLALMRAAPVPGQKAKPAYRRMPGPRLHAAARHAAATLAMSGQTSRFSVPWGYCWLEIRGGLSRSWV